MQDTDAEFRSSIKWILAAAIFFFVLGIFFQPMPGLSGFTFGAAFSFALIGFMLPRLRNRTIGDVITRERFFIMRKFIWLILIVPALLALFATSNHFLLGFMAAPGIMALIMFSGMMMGAANTYLYDTEEN